MTIIDALPYCGASFIEKIEELAIKIYENKDDDIIISLDYEGFDITHNGLEQAVQNIADYTNIPYNQISFLTNDMLAKSNVFKNQYIGWNEAGAWGIVDYFPEISFPKISQYAQLLGRADNERLYGHHKHLTWYNGDRGIATCHLDIYNINEYHSEFSEFVMEYNKEYNFIKRTLPYSDIGGYIDPPIIFGNMSDTDFWETLYRNISIELVYETVNTADTFYITEKTLRPIQYGKLFMVVGANDFEKHLKDLGYDIFEDIIDKSYDTSLSYIRVDQIYNSLEEFLKTDPGNLLKLESRLKHNQQVLNEFIKENKRKRDDIS